MISDRRPPLTQTPQQIIAGLNIIQPRGTLLIRGTHSAPMTNMTGLATDDGGKIDHKNLPQQRSIGSEVVHRVGVHMPQQ